MTDAFRFPAEWEPQSAVLIAWPHADTDWAERLADVEETYVALVAAITRFQSVVICVADDDLQTYAEARLRSARVDMDQVRFIAFDYDDTWLRDSGPIVLREGERVHAFVNRCPHFGAPLAEQQAQLIQKPMASLTCNVHYARFDWADGRCARGPCEGEALTPVPVARDTAGALAVGPLRPG